MIEIYQKALAELKNLMNISWDKARRFESRRISRIKRLRKFPLWKRLLLYRKFSKIRLFIKTDEWTRAHLVSMALALSKRKRTLERRIKIAQQQNTYSGS